MDKVREQLIADNIKYYKDSIVVPKDISDYINDAITKFKSSDDIILTESMIDRFSVNMQLLKYNYIFPRSNLATTCFRVSLINAEGTDSTTSVCGFLYTEILPTGTKPTFGGYTKTDEKPAELNITDDNTQVYVADDNNPPIDYDSFDPDYLGGGIDVSQTRRHIFAAFGGTYISQDGEYRRRVIPFSRIKTLRDKFPAVIELYEEAITSLMTDEKLIFNAEVFYPPESEIIVDKTAFTEDINTTRCAIYLFLFSLLVDRFLIEFGIIENHVNPAYLYIIGNGVFTDVFNKVMAITTPDEYLRIIGHTETYDFKTAEKNVTPIRTKTLRVGQKIFPLTNGEANERLNIGSSVWLEYYINLITRDIMLNMISPSFAVMQADFMITNACSNIYDNASAEIKYTNSDIVETITDTLESADEATKTSDGQHRNKKFEKLSSFIQHSIDYADFNMKVAPNALVVMSEYTGRTIRDLPSYITSKAPDNDKWKTFHRDAGAYIGYMFEFTYALFCMNTIAGCLHGDLHVNNVTINRHRIFPDNKLRYKLYVIEGTSAYILEHIGAYGTLIDFSRSIVGNKKMIANDFGTTYADIFIDKQRQRIHTLISESFPKLYETNKRQLDATIDNNYENLFNVISIIDMHVLSLGCSRMFKQETSIKFAPEIITITNKIVDATEDLFNKHFTELFTDPTKPQPNLNAELLKLLWENNKLTTKTPKHFVDAITDVFVYTPDLKYSFNHYNSFPPVLKVESIIDTFKKNNVKDPGFAEYLDFILTTQSDAASTTTKKAEYKRMLSDPSSWMYRE